MRVTKQRAELAGATCVLLLSACTPTVGPTGRGADDGDGPGLVLVDGGRPSNRDAGPGGSVGGGDGGGGGGVGGGGGIGDPAMFDTDVPLDATRPVDIMPRDRLARVVARTPRVADDWVRGVLEGGDTMWYDHASIVPGYQDSFGDNVVTPIGMRPNTIDSGLIDLAVPGGHGWIFQERGVFHFPFGRPGRSDEAHLYVADFWRLPREGGTLMPVVWWQRDPNSYTHRVEWMFPVGTVLGEMMFVLDASGELWPFEVRVRIREIDRWRVDLLRPFPTAADFAGALERKRAERPEWSSSSEIDALIDHLRDPSTLVSASLSSPQFRGAFPTLNGAEDVLPALSDTSILRELLLETPFRSVRGQVWKESGGLRTYAPTTRAAFHIVPRDYAGGFLRVDEESCRTCHRDAGRPFRDWYPDIIAYGELWGEDESFSWHPFETSRFVDASGEVQNFNHDNRALRRDFVSAGVIVEYDPGRHGGDRYRKLPGEWKDYAY